MSVNVSVIVPVYNSAATLERCLKALSVQDFDSFEVIVVDNGSADGSVAIIESWQKKYPVDLHLIHENRRGAGAARNSGVSEAKGEWLAFTDSDCEPDRDWLSTGWRLIETNSPEAMAGTAWGSMQGGLSAKLLGLTTLSVGLQEHWRDSSGETGVNGFATANFWIKKMLFDQLRGFDEELTASGEDYDLCARIYGIGKRILYSPELKVLHHHLSGFSDLLFKAVRYGRAHGMLFERYGKPGLHLDFSNGRKSMAIRRKVWINLVSADKKALSFLLLSFIWPISFLLLLLYPLLPARFLRERAAKAGESLSWYEAYIMGWLMIFRSLAFTLGRIQGHRPGVWML